MSSHLRTPWLLFGCSLVVIACLGALLLWKESDEVSEPLILQCAAALRIPIEELVPIYERQTDQRVEVRYGESQKILTDIELSGQGDVFLPADESYIEVARMKGLLGDIFPLGSMNAVFVVNKDSKKSIAEWNDLFKKDVRIAIANPQAAAITRALRLHLEKTGKWTQLTHHSEGLVEMGPVTDVANAVRLQRTVDGGFIWDAMTRSPKYRDLKIVRMKELEGIEAMVKIGVVKKSEHYAKALHFTRFILMNPEIFRKHGFTIISAPDMERSNSASEQQRVMKGIASDQARERFEIPGFERGQKL